ncbi:MAG: helix-turn-helix domain-containing protein [Patescibacteria group bacterium]|nr:helix-turn-helix domain-containing protein [Patescibacteria group bacterium]
MGKRTITISKKQVRQLAQQGKSRAAIAELAGVSPRRVYQLAPVGRHYKRFTAQEIASIHRLHDKGYSLRRIADTLGRSRHDVRRHFASGPANLKYKPSAAG